MTTKQHTDFGRPKVLADRQYIQIILTMDHLKILDDYRGNSSRSRVLRLLVEGIKGDDGFKRLSYQNKRLIEQNKKLRDKVKNSKSQDDYNLEWKEELINRLVNIFGGSIDKYVQGDRGKELRDADAIKRIPLFEEIKNKVKMPSDELIRIIRANAPFSFNPGG